MTRSPRHTSSSGSLAGGQLARDGHSPEPANVFEDNLVMNEESCPQTGVPYGAPSGRKPNLRQRILVVEDDSAIRRVNTEVLIYSGYEVDSAEDGAAAWGALQTNNYDLMITDNEMPKVTGVELIQKIKAAGLELPVIMATGTMPGDNFDPFRSLQPAITLLKPYTFDELLAAVKRVLWTATAALGAMAPPPNWQGQPPADRLPE